VGGTYPLCRSNLAGVDHDEELHEVVVNLAATSLDDVDILAADTLT
jgi:hypothetical protein